MKELQSRGEAAGAKVLCPVPHVTGGLTEPQVVPSFLASLQVCCTPSHPLKMMSGSTHKAHLS